MFHSVTFKSDKYHRSIGSYDFSGYYIQFLEDPVNRREYCVSCTEVFQQDGIVSTVDGVNIQPSIYLCNRVFTNEVFLWIKYKKKGCLFKTALCINPLKVI